MSRVSRKRVEGKRCYACEEPAVGEEHFPPKAFVPRKHRMDAFEKLPACHRHNQGRSGDDQYVAALVSMVSRSTYDDPEHATTMVRGLHRRNAALFKRINRHATALGRDTALEVELDRAERVFGDIARAAVFVESVGSAKMCGEVIVSAVNKCSHDPLPPKLAMSIRHDPRVQQLIGAFDRTDVFPVRERDSRFFFYQVKPTRPYLIYMVFNSQVEVVVVDKSGRA